MVVALELFDDGDYSVPVEAVTPVGLEHRDLSAYLLEVVRSEVVHCVRRTSGPSE
jgi:hypothetical protein